MSASWALAGVELESRLLLGTALFPSPEVMATAVRAAGTQVVTCSLRRQNPAAAGGSSFWSFIRELGLHLLPNTAGCKSVQEAVTTARMARELFGTHWLKLELIGDDYTLQPDTTQLVEAAGILVEDGFEVFAYTTEDLVVAQRLVAAGVRIVMPWASPIGSGQGLLNEFALRTLRERLPEVTLVVDAGIGKPSDATRAMELGYDAVLVNSAVALSREPQAMGEAFRHAVVAGRIGYESGFMAQRDMAAPSTPTLGTPFWHLEEDA